MEAQGELYVVVSKGDYTGAEFPYGPYSKRDAEAVLDRMIAGQTQHTTKSIRPYVKGEKTYS